MDRVNEYLEHGDCYPLYMEISPVGNCNHRCIFCAYDYLGYPNRKLETERTLSLLDELADCGLRSILFAGEGEPLIHPDLSEFIFRAQNRGIDTALFTNGQLLKRELSEKILPALTFIRFSFNGGTRGNYSDIHSVRPEVFDRVVSNIKETVEIRKKYGLRVDIGVQFVLLPENFDFLLSAIDILNQCGVDYVAIKPFMQRESQAYRLLEQFTPDKTSDLFEEAEKRSDDAFKVIIRKQTFQEYGVRNYERCYGTPFISVLNSAGIISTCLPYWEREAFSYGSIYENSFQEIWCSTERAAIKQNLEHHLMARDCPPNCRSNSINDFLWNLRHPTVRHLNFI
jgi:MoaA/NifB/PqqE/SkfB family radical SAM enzyme